MQVDDHGKAGLGKNEFKKPTDMALGPDGNPDGPHRILAMDLDGNLLAAFGSTGVGPGQFDVPHSIALDAAKNLYVAEVNNKRIQKFAPAGSTVNSPSDPLKN